MLQEGKDGLNAFVVVSDSDGSRLLQVAEKDNEELKVGDVFEKLGGSAWDISVVNDNVLSAGPEQCVLYDITQQKEVKSLSLSLLLRWFCAQ